MGGFDSILEELYLVFGKAAVERGYSFLAYEDPGQNEPRPKHGRSFTPLWEQPTRAVLDEFLSAHAKPAKTALIGMSRGGYPGHRAATFDKHFDGLVAFDTCFDVGEALGSGSCYKLTTISVLQQKLLYSHKAIQSRKLPFTGQLHGKQAKFGRIAQRMFPQTRQLSLC